MNRPKVIPRIGKTRLLLFLAIVGPGIIAGSADNDAPGISTYSAAGGRFGYSMLWMLLIVTFSLAITQEMGARMGIVTGKPLAALIRERFSIRITFFAVAVMLIADMGTTIGEFSGTADGFQLFGLSKYYMVPIVAVMVWLLVVRGSYRFAEKAFLILSVFYVTYVVSALLAHPNWHQALKGTVIPSFQLNSSYILLFIAVIGTTITPWGQSFIQSYVIDKGISIKHLRYSRIDIITGAILTDVIAAFIVIACAATIYASGGQIDTAAQAASGLVPLAGQFASSLFAFGLLNASVLAAAVLPLATSYAICGALGFESGISHSFKEAPAFHGIYTFLIGVAAVVALIPGLPLFQIMLLSQDLNGLLLPIILIFVMLLINDKRIMGKYVNGRIFNIVSWATIGSIILLSLLLVVTSFFS